MLILKFRMISILLEASTQQAKVKASIPEGEMTRGVSILAGEMSMTMTNLINPTKERTLGMISIQLEGATIHRKISILVVIEKVVSTLT